MRENTFHYLAILITMQTFSTLMEAGGYPALQ